MATNGVRVKRDVLKACMTCPLCRRLLRDATTISECLHTFCRKCIYVKLTDEEADCCPICNIDLGALPIEKLRPDHNLQDVRAKIFPLKRRKVEAPEVVTPISPPVRRKERSLSSLVVNTPRVATQTGLTGRRTKPAARRAAALRALSPVVNEPCKMEDDNTDQSAENSCPTENATKFAPNRKVTSTADQSNNVIANDTDNGGKSDTDKAELWKPLNCLVEAANKTKSFKSSLQSPAINMEQTTSPANEGNNLTRVKENQSNYEVQDERNNNNAQTSSVPQKSRRLKGTIRKKKDSGNSAQALLDAACAQQDRPTWFSLTASPDQSGDSPLPQIPVNYLKITDGNMTASLIQKYLAHKLNLSNDAEVEIMSRGQPVSPTTTMHTLVEQWAKGESSHKTLTTIGSSGKEWVMVLNYARVKAPAQSRG